MNYGLPYFPCVGIYVKTHNLAFQEELWEFFKVLPIEQDKEFMILLPSKRRASAEKLLNKYKIDYEIYFDTANALFKESS